MIIEDLEKRLGVIFTEEEMDYYCEKGDSDLFLEEIRRRQKASQREKRRHLSSMEDPHPSSVGGHHYSVKNREKGHHPSVKMIPASK